MILVKVFSYVVRSRNYLSLIVSLRLFDQFAPCHTYVVLRFAVMVRTETQGSASVDSTPRRPTIPSVGLGLIKRDETPAVPA